VKQAESILEPSETELQHKDLLRLNDRLLSLGQLVSGSVGKVSGLLQTFDPVLIQEIRQTETEVNALEVEIEAECLKLLALHRPSSFDLRRIVSGIKVNSNLERIGDQVINIAERVEFLANIDRLILDHAMNSMSATSARMVKLSLEAISQQDVSLAERVREMDRELNAQNARSYKTLQEGMEQQPNMVRQAVSYLTISSNIERIGDLATNIAGQVVFLVHGKIDRH